jgi:hypothetical protein
MSFFQRLLDFEQTRDLRRRCGSEMIFMFSAALLSAAGWLSVIDVMEESAISRRKVSSKPLSGPELNALLAVFDSDVTRAAEKYETARAGLIKIFRSRGFWNEAETLADRTLDVSARRVLDKASTAEPVRNIHPYMIEVARRIASEAHRRPLHLPLDESVQPAFSVDHVAGQTAQIHESKLDYLEKLVQELPDRERTIILEYHRYSRSLKMAHHAGMARDNATSRGALRVKVFRIRRRLARKLRDCFGADEAGETS